MFAWAFITATKFLGAKYPKLNMAYAHYSYSNQPLRFYGVAFQVTIILSWVVAMPLLLNKHLVMLFCEVPVIGDAYCFRFLGHR